MPCYYPHLCKSWGSSWGSGYFSESANWGELQAFGSVEFCKISGKRSQRKMAGFPRCFENQAIREAQRRAVAILFECRGDGVRFLNGELSMMQKHFGGRRDLRVSEVVHGRKHPGRLHENQGRHPCPFAREGFRGGNLLAVVAGDQTDQDVGVNGAQVFS